MFNTLKDEAHRHGKTVTLYLFERAWGSRFVWFMIGMAFLYAVQRGVNPGRIAERWGVAAFLVLCGIVSLPALVHRRK